MGLSGRGGRGDGGGKLSSVRAGEGSVVCCRREGREVVEGVEDHDEGRRLSGRGAEGVCCCSCGCGGGVERVDELRRLAWS